MKLWPFRAEKKALTDEQIFEMVGGGVPTATGIAVSSETALKVPAVAAAVRTIAEAAASLRVKVVEIAADETETHVPGHPVADLLKNEANDWTSGFELIRSLTVDALTRDAGGLGWVNRVGGEPREIIRYRPGFINVDYPDDTLQPRYRINGVIQPGADIVHVRSTFSKCPVTLCREAIGVALVMEKHAGKIFANGARPGGQILTPKQLGDEGARKMIKGFMAAHGGPDKAGGTPILWDGAEFKPIAMNSVDLQFQQLRIVQLQEIARAFNIPAILLGDLSRATWSNSAEMQRLFLMLCLEPWLKALESAFRRALFSKEDRKRYAVRFERDDFSKVDLAVLASAINSLVASRVINPNTGRDWLDLPPYVGGETYANPNTGSSQPGSVPKNDTPPKPDNENDLDKEPNDDT